MPMIVKLWSYTDRDLYELMKKQGDKRFGSECRHEKVRNGICTNCLRRVISR
jgi:hypothetical protein